MDITFHSVNGKTSYYESAKKKGSVRIPYQKKKESVVVFCVCLDHFVFISICVATRVNTARCRISRMTTLERENVRCWKWSSRNWTAKSAITTLFYSQHIYPFLLLQKWTTPHQNNIPPKLCGFRENAAVFFSHLLHKRIPLSLSVISHWHVTPIFKRAWPTFVSGAGRHLLRGFWWTSCWSPYPFTEATWCSVLAAWCCWPIYCTTWTSRVDRSSSASKTQSSVSVLAGASGSS